MRGIASSSTDGCSACFSELSFRSSAVSAPLLLIPIFIVIVWVIVGCFSLPLRFLALAPSKMEVVLVDTTSTTGDVHVQRMKQPDSKQKAANWKEDK